MGERVHRLDYITGLRAIAVLAVIAYHAVAFGPWSAASLSAPMSPRPLWWTVTLFSKGSHGVDLFFVLSGFCLAYPTLAKVRATGRSDFDLANFFAKRAVRIGPPFWIALVVSAVAVLTAARLGVRVPDVDLAGAAFVPTLRQALFLDRDTPLANGSFWTLFFEVRWYVVFPVLLALYVRNERLFIAVLVGLAAAYQFTTLHAVDIAVLPAFMLGIVAADWKITGRGPRRRLLIALLVSLDFALVLEPFASIPPSNGAAETPLFAAQSNVGWQLTCFCLVVGAGRWRFLERALSAWPLVAIGTASYSIYLLQQLVITYWEEAASPSASAVVAVLGSFALSLVAGGIFFAGVERPLTTTRFRGAVEPAIRAAFHRLLVVCGVRAIEPLSSSADPG